MSASPTRGILRKLNLLGVYLGRHQTVESLQAMRQNLPELSSWRMFATG